MKKTNDEEITKLRAKISAIILSCKNYEQLENCEKWFYKVRTSHPLGIFLQGHFNSMFTFMYLQKRKQYLNHADNGV